MATLSPSGAGSTRRDDYGLLRLGAEVSGMSEDAALERGTVRAITWRLLPLIGLGYLVAFVDRVNIGFAQAGMHADLGFTASIYGFGGGLFFFSYALLEIPSNLVLARLGARRWLARIMVTWGLVAMSMALVRTPWQFYL